MSQNTLQYKNPMICTRYGWVGGIRFLVIRTWLAGLIGVHGVDDGIVCGYLMVIWAIHNEIIDMICSLCLKVWQQIPQCSWIPCRIKYLPIVMQQGQLLQFIMMSQSWYSSWGPSSYQVFIWLSNTEVWDNLNNMFEYMWA